MDNQDLHGVGQANFAGQAVSVCAARTWANGLLTGRVADEVRETVVLLLSELVTNSVVHSDSGRRPDGQVIVFLAVGDGAAYCEVIDDGSDTSIPGIREVSLEGDGGRGLWMVNAMADAWGFHHDDGVGNAVWFRMGMPPATVAAVVP
ncbi:ATP-binding protein [Sphaerimonospora cavernae]|uniref:ATP-binding protein n=1 Tax=Sphaerimonospora cavernae TaxID=1740611 RepID=A0ABV6TZP0_9ACTN